MKTKKPGKRKGVGIDFKRVKTKVGKKLRKPENATNTEIKSQVIHLPQQTLGEEKGEAVTQRNLTLKELLGQLGHYNPKVRRDALDGLKELLLQHPAVLHTSIGPIIEKTAERMSDPEAGVRASLRTLLQTAVLPSVPPEVMSPFFPPLLAHVSAALTHMASTVRSDAMLALGTLLDRYPTLLSHAALVEILGHFANMLSASGIGTITGLTARGGTAKIPKALLETCRSFHHVLTRVYPSLDDKDGRYSSVTVTSSSSSTGAGSGGGSLSWSGAAAAQAGMRDGDADGGGPREHDWLQLSQGCGSLPALHSYKSRQPTINRGHDDPHAWGTKAAAKKTPVLATIPVDPPQPGGRGAGGGSGGDGKGGSGGSKGRAKLPSPQELLSQLGPDRDAGHYAALAAAFLPLLMDCWVDCTPALVAVDPDLISLHTMAEVTGAALLLLRGLSEHSPPDEVNDDAAGVAAGGNMGAVGVSPQQLWWLFREQLVNLLMAHFPLAASKIKLNANPQLTEAIASVNQRVCKVMAFFLRLRPQPATGSQLWMGRHVAASWGAASQSGSASGAMTPDMVEEPWACSLLNFCSSCLTGEAVVTDDLHLEQGLPSRSEMELALPAALEVVEQAVPVVSPDRRHQLLKAVEAAFRKARAQAPVKRICLNFMARILRDTALQPHLPGDVVEEWMRHFPRLLWELKAKQPAMSETILELILRLLQRTPEDSPMMPACASLQGLLVPFFATKTPARDGSGTQTVLGPFASLPPRCQRLAVHSLFYFATISAGMLSALAACCMAKEVADDIAAEVVDVVQHCSASIELPDYVSFLFTLLVGPWRVADKGPQQTTGGEDAGSKSTSEAVLSQWRRGKALVAAVSRAVVNGGPAMLPLLEPSIMGYLGSLQPPSPNLVFAAASALLAGCRAGAMGNAGVPEGTSGMPSAGKGGAPLPIADALLARQPSLVPMLASLLLAVCDGGQLLKEEWLERAEPCLCLLAGAPLALPSVTEQILLSVTPPAPGRPERTAPAGEKVLRATSALLLLLRHRPLQPHFVAEEARMLPCFSRMRDMVTAISIDEEPTRSQCRTAYQHLHNVLVDLYGSKAQSLQLGH
eukprot:jgi/Mesvir1/17223/Mv07637-RA.1